MLAQSSQQMNPHGSGINSFGDSRSSMIPPERSGVKLNSGVGRNEVDGPYKRSIGRLFD
ncbi:MAG TPA: hypothetical protein V6C96_02785 [Vampirovibrionales bacterium]